MTSATMRSTSAGGIGAEDLASATSRSAAARLIGSNKSGRKIGNMNSLQKR